MNICIAGVGYVGLVTGICLSYLGNQVTCIDIDAEKINKLRAGIPTFYEPGIKEMLDICLKQKTISFSTEIKPVITDADVIFIAVGTPSLPSGEPNMEFLEQVAFSIGEAMDQEKLRVIINKSTVPIGSGNWVEMIINEGVKSAYNSCKEKFATCLKLDFIVASNPEFLREGSAIYDTLYPDRIVIGTSDDRARGILNRLYEPILQQSFTPPIKEIVPPPGISAVPLVVTDITSAEMIKYASNSFLATKISFINEIANICELVGADVNQVAKGIGLDSRIGGKFLNAGIGWGGSCFGKDLKAIISIAKEYDYMPKLLESTIEVNYQQRQAVIKKLQQSLKIIKGRHIGVMGLSFKPNTDDLRDAPSLTIITQLLKMGAKVRAYDPIAMDNCRKQFPDLNVEYVQSVDELAIEADALILVTEWDEFKYMSLEETAQKMKEPILIDTRNVYVREKAHKAGFTYYSIGRN